MSQNKEKIVFKELKALEKIDDLIFQEENCFYWDASKIKEIKISLISKSFEYHYNKNNDYQNYCKKFNISPDQIKNYDDLNKIPLIPTTQFKIQDILSCNRDEIVKVCLSSGTKGSVSKLYRDDTTLNRFLGSIQSAIEKIFNIDDCFCINLGPSTAEAGDLWFSYAISVTDLIFPTENFVKNDVFLLQDTYNRIIEYKDKYENLVIIGAPIMFVELMKFMKENGLKINDSSTIFFITAGGWKKFSGESIKKEELCDQIKENFINADKNKIRDILNMVELNTVLPECTEQVKHIVPWVHIRILNPETLENVKTGEMGLIAFLDPTTSSYPCFILTDDFGRLLTENSCKCGRTGQGLEIIRRVSNVEARGCALKIDNKFVKKI